MTKYYLIIIPVVLFFSCSMSSGNRQFSSEEMGWELDYPDKWKEMSEKEINNLINDGKEIVKEQGNKLNVKNDARILMAIKRTTSNKLQASIIPFEESFDGHWLYNFNGLKRQIHHVYAGSGMMVDTSSTREIIDGVPFEVFKSEVKQTRHHQPLFTSDMYRTLRNGHDFIVIINYTNNRTKKQILDAWRASRFTD